MNFNQVSEKIRTSAPLDFGAIFNASFDLFKKVWIQGFITLLLAMVSIIPFYIIVYTPMFAMGINDPYYFEDYEPSLTMALIYLVAYPILIIGIATVSNCLNAAFLRICKQADMGETTKDDYFFYFKKPYFAKAFTLALIAMGLSILGMLACGIGIIYLAVPMSLMPIFFAFEEELSASEITKASFALGNKNWLVIFGLIFVMGIIAQLGILLCVVGVFFTAALSRIPTYFIYKNAIGFSSSSSDKMTAIEG